LGNWGIEGIEEEGYRLYVIGYWLLVIGYGLFVKDYEEG